MLAATALLAADGLERALAASAGLDLGREAGRVGRQREPLEVRRATRVEHEPDAGLPERLVRAVRRVVQNVAGSPSVASRGLVVVLLAVAGGGIEGADALQLDGAVPATPTPASPPSSPRRSRSPPTDGGEHERRAGAAGRAPCATCVARDADAAAAPGRRPAA